MIIGGALTYYAWRRDRLDMPGLALVLAGGSMIAKGMDGSENGPRRMHGPAATVDAEKATRVEGTVAIDRPVADVYAFWRELNNLPRFMTHLHAVQLLSADRSRWSVRTPSGGTLTWDAEIVNDVPPSLIAWKSVAGSEIPNAGSVHFLPDRSGSGTVVKVVLEYEPPTGMIGRFVATLTGEEPARQIGEDLRRLKALLEAA
ncbi:MAG: SRPBCC family protein [Gemmatimonadaceae bacterium]